MKNPAAGGGRWVEVPPERLVSWIVAFAIRHGGARSVSRDETGRALTFTAADGATAECHPPFPPMREAGRPDADVEDAEGAKDVEDVEGTKNVDDAKDVENAEDVEDAVGEAEAMVVHALADRTVGVLLVRLGGYAVGVFAGSPPELVSSKTGSRLVHGRSAAGGWSQHRFARRRENQAAAALRAAADAAAAIFGPYGADGLDAVVLGGDKRSIAGLRGDARLEPYLAKAADRFLTVPDPRLAVLRQIPQAFTSIRIRLTEPGGTR
jgi:Actinobacteria/chloroflexi VLRF1 release factor